ncbi:TIGR03087 family PEP-CTERM/XrtA system glycosyltransferase [Motiliproteus sp. SC1-56]|uniref:TIGR03087 family PEP-CTERM/XrtA system glycosyltransferase n=1 Tax=Motiliproteus sp. SC1-56 TaxID=2799565 RepID=UPI001A8ECF60|nr:TIGR03087 family PEP-CTERM/XrtA system glycosyltransferase [Motiliproteus sp. SC1-56]
MEHVVFLCHRIPYPPNKGDKIRSYNLLRYLVERYKVHLGCFVDDPADQAFTEKLAPLCESLLCLPLRRGAGYLATPGALISGTPLTLAFYRSRRMQRWVDEITARFDVSRFLVFSSSMAQYLEGERFAPKHRVIDFVDVDSAKWAQYAAHKKGVASWIYRREHRTLRLYESAIAAQFDRAIFVSADEADLFKQQLTQRERPKVSFLPNGVDTHYFDPEKEDCATAPCPSRYVAFTGAMDYWANVDAVVWFCQHVWPTLRSENPDLRFLIVGGNPAKEVLELQQLAGVEVTGRVKDIRPYIGNATLVIAPLRIARGIQNKVLEAMAMARPVVATSMAMEGLKTTASLCLKVADEPAAFIEACSDYLSGDTGADGSPNRTHVLRHYGWPQVLEQLPSHLEGVQ